MLLNINEASGFEMPAELVDINESITDEAIVAAALMEYFTPEELSEENISYNKDLKTLVESDILQEKTIIRMDKNAKMNKMYKLALYSILKKRNAKMFGKLKLAIKMKKSIVSLADKKYGAQAKVLAKAMMRRVATKPKVKEAIANKGKTLVIKPKKAVTTAADITKLSKQIGR